MALIQLSCQELPPVVDGGRVVASVGNKSLSMSEVISATPLNLSGEDSVAFVKVYAEKWIQRQVKISEAEQVFTSSVNEIEDMVASYRQTLLTRKLDQYYIDSSKEAPFTDKDIESYYNTHSQNFRLDSPIVKGNILRIPSSHSSTSKLTSLMKSTSKDSRQDLISISEKFEDLELEQFGSTWVNYSDFIAMLPIVRDNTIDQYMRRTGVQSLKDDTHTYLFEINEYRDKDGVTPLEMADAAIRRLLTNEYHSDLIRKHEERLYNEAVHNNLIRNYTNVDQSENGEKGYLSTFVDNMKSEK